MAIKTSLGAQRYNSRMAKTFERATASKAAHAEKVKEFGKMKDVNKAASAFKDYQTPDHLKSKGKALSKRTK